MPKKTEMNGGMEISLKKGFPDITGDIGPLFNMWTGAPPKVTMFSYNKPAWLFWQGFYEGVRQKGLTHEEAIAELQSKGVRWLLDAHSDSLNELGKKLAKDYVPVLK